MRKHFATAVVLFLAFSSSSLSQDFDRCLEEADHLAWLTNWYAALPSTRKSNARRRNLVIAAMRSTQVRSAPRPDADTPLPDLSDQIAADLNTPLAKEDRRLRLRAARAPRLNGQRRYRPRMGRARRRA